MSSQVSGQNSLCPNRRYVSEVHALQILYIDHTLAGTAQAQIVYIDHTLAENFTKLEILKTEGKTIDWECSFSSTLGTYYHPGASLVEVYDNDAPALPPLLLLHCCASLAVGELRRTHQANGRGYFRLRSHGIPRCCARSSILAI